VQQIGETWSQVVDPHAAELSAWAPSR
jgi:hypothetical protein